MKVLMTFLSLLVVLGVLYGLGFAGILPTQKWADKSPKLAKTLIAMHLAKAKKKPTLVAANTKTPAAPDPERVKLDADRAQLEKDKQDFAAQKQQAAQDAQANTPPPATPVLQAKLIDIYQTMAPEDVARILTKQSDANVIMVLTQLDEKKAGKILAVLPPDRAAKISQTMAHSLSSSAAPSVAQATPHTPVATIP